MEPLSLVRTEAQVHGLPTAIELPTVRLAVIEGPDSGRHCDSDDEMLLRIGTRENNGLVLSDKSVSGYHAEIAGTQTGWRLRDVGSTNGSFVSGMRVFDIVLRSGTVITLGRTKIRFETRLDEPVRAALHPAGRFGDMVGQSVPMRRLFSRIAKVARSISTVLISGETGTGKEAVAEALVQASLRSCEPFVVVDCSSLPHNLIESELFGHVKGAFTGAVSDYRGAFERADGGTIFLDEIGELPFELQPKLLRVIERREVRRIGAERSRTIDVRVVAATNRVLATEVNERRFRQDLYYRLSVVNIHVPPLRERREDIPFLVEHFYEKIASNNRGPLLTEITERLCSNDYTWPGNVRELRNAVERVFHIPDEDPFLSEETLPHVISPAESTSAIDLAVPFKAAKQKLIDAFEKEYLQAMLRSTRGNISEAARRAQIDRMHLHKLITQHHLSTDA